MSITPEALEAEFSLTTAATRLDFLSRRDNGDTTLNTVHDDDEDGWGSLKAADTQLDVHESLELLALGEVVARKAHDSRLVGIRAALRGGADWDEIARALGVSPERPGTTSRTRSRAARQRRRVGRPRAGRVPPRPLTGRAAGQLTSTPCQKATRPVISFAASFGLRVVPGGVPVDLSVDLEVNSRTPCPSTGSTVCVSDGRSTSSRTASIGK